MKNILNKLNKIQVELKAPKGQFNKFGKYNYRNCEDILEALKPLLEKYKAVINIKDEIIVLGDKDTVININDEINGEIKVVNDRYYVKATATLYDIESGESIETTAFAREEENKKGMDSSQITGSASSYARKYALNGLLAIDDTKDSDSTNKHGKDDIGPNKGENKAQKNDLISAAQQNRLYAISKGKNDIAKRILGNYGFNSSKEVTKEYYEAICKDIESIVGA